MAKFEVSVSHVDTCLPCYVQDHHNREGKLLLGVPVSRSSRIHHVKSGLRDELNAADWGIPEELSDEEIYAAINECFEGVNPLKSFDSSLEPDSSYEMVESCYAWFLIEWSENEESDE